MTNDFFFVFFDTFLGYVDGIDRLTQQVWQFFSATFDAFIRP